MENEFTQKAAAWLGVAVTIIGLMAFFGINSWDDFNKKFSSDQGAESACHAAWEAAEPFLTYIRKNGYFEHGSGVAARAFAGGLSEAKEKTDKSNLTASFSANIYSLSDLEEALKGDDEQKSGEDWRGLKEQVIKDWDGWDVTCRKLWDAEHK